MAYAFLFITETESAGLGNNEYYRVFIDERYLIQQYAEALFRL